MNAVQLVRGAGACVCVRVWMCVMCGVSSLMKKTLLLSRMFGNVFRMEKVCL